MKQRGRRFSPLLTVTLIAPGKASLNGCGF